MLAVDGWTVVVGVGTVLLVVLTAILIVFAALPFLRSRKERSEDRAAEDAGSERQAAAAAEAELVGKAWHFQHRLRVAVGDVEPTEPPIEISVQGANVWVHEVRLTWKPSQPPIAYWVTKDAPCPPWRDGSLPYQLSAGSRPVQLGWPGPNPEQQAQITQKVKVVYSALRDGPRQERETDGGSVAWQ